MTSATSTKFPLGIYVGNPGDANFLPQYNAFVADMGGARPLYMDSFTDFNQDPSQWASNANWAATSSAATGSSVVGPGSGVTPVVGLPLASNAGGWSNVDTFYQQIIAGTYDADYKGVVDSWANAGYSTVQFRLGYEFNTSYMPWSPGNSSSPTANADFVAAFQHVANLIHSESSAKGVTGQVDWNTADINNNGVDPTKLYPGDKYVDVISTDTYSPLYPNDYTDWSTGGTTQISAAAWGANAVDRAHFWQYTNATQSNPTPGLGTTGGWSFQDSVNFALLHNKPLSVSETGSGTAASAIGPADDPAYANWLASALTQAQNAGVHIQNVDIWDITVGDGDWNFTNGSKPLAAAAWAADFGAASGQAATTTTTTTTATPVVTPVTIGSGSDSLVLQVSEDAWNGNAQFTVQVDGQQIGGTQTATASHAAGQTQALTVLGSFSGSHTATINFLNDAYGGSSSQDRNLYVNGATIDGAAVSGSSLTETSSGPGSFAFTGPAAVVVAPVAGTTIGSGSDSLVLQVSEDAWNGDAQFTVQVDGQQIGGTQTATASHAAGQTQALTVLGSFSGSHTATINFLNDAYGGSSSQDRNLYVNGASIDGTAVSGSSLTEDSGGPSSFAFTGPAAVAAGTTIGSGSDSLVLQVSEDAWNGNAQFTVQVDGQQIGGTQTATATHAAGQTQALTVLGSFSGSHSASVTFLNDAYGGTASQDRNLYVNGATIDGTAVSGSSLAEYSGGPSSFAFIGPAAGTTIGSGSGSLVLQLSEDAWNGNAQFTVQVDGQQVGGTQTATASHAAGQTQALTVLGSFSGSHTATVNFLNDAYGGSSSQDRNLYVNSATVNGAAVSGSSLAEYSGGPQSFTFHSS